MERIICNIKQLRDRLRGNKDCTLMISRSCEIEISKMPYEDYLILKQELDLRNINIFVKRR